MLGEIWAQLAGTQGRFRAGSAQSDGELAASTLGAVVPQRCVAMAGSLALNHAVAWNVPGRISACCPGLGREPGDLLAMQGDFKPGNLRGRRGSVCVLCQLCVSLPWKKRADDVARRAGALSPLCSRVLFFPSLMARQPGCSSVELVGLASSFAGDLPLSFPVTGSDGCPREGEGRARPRVPSD